MLQKFTYFIKKLSAIYRLVRFEHAIMFAFAVFIGEMIAIHSDVLCKKDMLNFITMIAQPEISIVTIILSLLVPIFSEMGAFALNDFLDVKTDKINKKIERPLVSGELSPNFALFLSVISFVLALFFAYLVSPLIFLLTIVINLLAILYNYILKDIALIGNIYIAFTMAIPFVFGNYVVDNALNPLNVLIAILGFTVGLGREIAKTIEDAKGDKKARNSQTLPMLIGSEKSIICVSLLYILAIVISIIPFAHHFYDIPVTAFYFLCLNIGLGFILVIIADIILFYLSLILILSKDKIQTLKFSRKMSLLALALGLIGIAISI